MNAPYLQVEPARQIEKQESAGYILVPTIVYAYSHNAGWFVGQQWGCSAGVRLRLLWAVYERRTGTRRFWMDVDIPWQAEGIFHPDRPTRQQLWNQVRSRMEDVLTDTFQS